MIRNGAVAGVVQGAVSLAGLKEVVMAIKPTPSSFSFVVSKADQILAHPDNALVLKGSASLSSDLTPERVATLASSTDMPTVSQDGSPKLLKVKGIPGTDWYLVVALDKAEATAGLSDMVFAGLDSP